MGLGLGVFMKISSKKILDFQRMIFSWWDKNKRDLPWRHTNDPYKILVSEVMLQQTQVLRVLSKYTEFIEVFPSVAHLAKASPAHVLRLWKGLGYNRRALYLYACAKEISKRRIFPDDEKNLMTLPGIGLYTARAIMVFAFKQDIAMIDTNIRQILLHYFYNNKMTREKDIVQTAELLVPHGKSWEWHQALMDFGALELPKNSKLIKKQQPFAGSNRFYRGKIIDFLREKNINENFIFHLFAKQKTKEEIRKIIDSLVKDKLIVKKKNGMLSLPLV